MTYIMPEIALATRDDVVDILNLQEQNLLGPWWAFERTACRRIHRGRARRSAADRGAPGWQDNRLSADGITRRTRSSPNHTHIVPCPLDS
jgi:hypothetical protein